MPTPSKIRQHIDRLVSYLVETGLSSHQQFCLQKSGAGQVVEVTFPGARHISIAMKDVFYTEIYDQLTKQRAYNVRMIDGAMLQMMYMFNGQALEKHRLSFLPSPHLDRFQSHPDIYLEDEMYADIVARSLVPFPLRFDYDARDGIYEELEHPKSHLSLGQYENCRIPVSSPLTPFHFIEFILRNFYHTLHQKYAHGLPCFNDTFAETIMPAEKRVIHVRVPRGV